MILLLDNARYSQAPKCRRLLHSSRKIGGIHRFGTWITKVYYWCILLPHFSPYLGLLFRFTNDKFVTLTLLCCFCSFWRTIRIFLVFRCQKSLNDYLDSKRRIFPRFFFISTDELLSILGSSECSCVQEHMIKVCGFYYYIFMSSMLLEWDGSVVYLVNCSYCLGKSFALWFCDQDDNTVILNFVSDVW